MQRAFLFLFGFAIVAVILLTYHFQVGINRYVLEVLKSGPTKTVLGFKIDIEKPKDESNEPQTNLTNILIWRNYAMNNIREGTVDPSCEYNACEITYYRGTFLDSKVVIFTHLRPDKVDLPPNKPANQKWIVYDPQNPQPTTKYTHFSDVMDGTFSYRDDADIHRPFGKYTKWGSGEANPYDPKKNYALHRSKLVAWMVNACHASSGRDEYVRELRKYIPVDIYGSCGRYRCNSKANCTSVMGQYKFYLAFEKVLCDQYITEAVWQTLNITENPVVPVVMGGANYEKYLPPNSFINIRDFKSPEELATYLKYLDENEDAYNEYFKWKQDYKLVFPRIDCELCRYANKLTSKQRNLHKHFIENRCVSPHAYFQGVADMLTNLPPVTGPHIADGKPMPQTRDSSSSSG